jgi:DNA-binding NtrC family response regulator
MSAVARTHSAPLGVASAPATRILLVEDNDGVRMATELFLKLEGFQVRSAASYAEALRLSNSLHEGEIIVADYHLDSAHTGLDVLAHVRAEQGIDVPGVILSGDLPTLVRTVSAPTASLKFMSKPVDTDALLVAIKELSAARDESNAALVRDGSGR